MDSVQSVRDFRKIIPKTRWAVFTKYCPLGPENNVVKKG